MSFDYSQMGPELIPHGTTATVQMRIRPGSADEDGLLTRTKTGDAEYLNCEFVVVEGPYTKRK